MAAESRRFLFSGHVQGVGFRMTAMRFADGLDVAGTVRNLGTGEVELNVRGSPGDIQHLVQRLCEQFEASVRTLDRAPPAVGPGAGLRVID